MSIENMSRNELIEAIVDWQVHTYMSSQNLSELRNILLYGRGYKTCDEYGHNEWTTDQLREYAKELGV